MKTSPKSFPLFKIFVFVTIFLLHFCSEKKEIILDEQKFVDLYAQLLILDEIADDSVARKLEVILLSDRGSSKTQIDSTLEYYRRNPEQWSEVLRQIRDRIKELRDTPFFPDSLKEH